ncbi:hypothetical protein CSHISOI_06311 [Colletotrichum shisoi]|uniref:Uncharacterized protein n=1 Tax=Colletotrichum shisoi TaxID=2078593 RepID=A0A5Q4BQC4_9PEZI|nr:hypothetical protein CSHISOI_06311 [Colletotrichum shisoi]
MLRDIFHAMVPLPRPAPIVCHPKGSYAGLGAIERYGIYNHKPAGRSGLVRCVAIRQQDQLLQDREDLLREKAEDDRVLVREYDIWFRELGDQYQRDMRSLRMDVRSKNNGDVLRARKFNKGFVRRVRALQRRQARDAIWLAMWYGRMASRQLSLLRKEWFECEYCRGYPFWGDAEEFVRDEQ